MSQMDAFGRHEVLHMACFLTGAVSNELCEHRQIKNNPAWLALADKACEALGDLYQAIGSEHGDESATSDPAPDNHSARTSDKAEQNQDRK